MLSLFFMTLFQVRELAPRGATQDSGGGTSVPVPEIALSAVLEASSNFENMRPTSSSNIPQNTDHYS
jgi:hypothetical protein